MPLITGIPFPPENRTFSISVTNGGDAGEHEFLTIHGFVGFVSRVEADQIMHRLRRAYLPFIERGLLPDPLIVPPRKTDDGTSSGAGFTISLAEHPQTFIREAIVPLLNLFQKLRLPEARLFVCHASEDKPLAKRLATYLSNLGAEVWLDEWEIRVGDSIVAKINEGLDAASHLAILLSANSIARPWVTRELSSALMRQLKDNSITVLPIRIDESPMPAILSDIRYADCRTNLEAGFDDVVHALFPTRRVNGG